MKYFKYLDIPNWKIVTDKALMYYYEHRDEYVSKFKPEGNPLFFSNSDPADIFDKIPEINLMLEPFNTVGIDVWFFEFGEHRPADNLIHKDNAPYESRMLLPLLNCENTETRYYVSTATSMDIPDIAITIPTAGSCTQVASFCLADGPVLMRPNEFHSVYMSEDNIYPRISMLLTTKDDLTYLLT